MFLSSTGLVKPRVNLGGPPPKAKYYLATDSGQVRRLKDEKNPDKGSKKDLKPYAYKRSEPAFGRVTACLLHNEPASWPLWQG